MDIKTLVSQMTLEEKAGLCSGDDFWHTKAVERLGIPRTMVSDGPHGLRKQDDAADHLGINDSIKAVCFPAACATAASFDPDGEIAARFDRTANLYTAYLASVRPDYGMDFRVWKNKN